MCIHTCVLHTCPWGKLGKGGGSPPQAPISYLVMCELFETLMFCDPPPPKPETPWGIYACKPNVTWRHPHERRQGARSRYEVLRHQLAVGLRVRNPERVQEVVLAALVQAVLAGAAQKAPALVQAAAVDLKSSCCCSFPLHMHSTRIFVLFFSSFRRY